MNSINKVARISKSIKILLLAVVILFTACDQATKTQAELTPDEVKFIAKEAYVYGFPMVMNYKTMYNYTLNEQYCT